MHAGISSAGINGQTISGGGNTGIESQPQRPWEELTERVEGKLLVLSSQDFLTHFKKLFNAASKISSEPHSTPEAVLFPLSAQDVSAGVQFAVSHSLSLSVKSGGYNPSNWCSSGQLVIDLSELNEISIDVPHFARKEPDHIGALQERSNSNTSSPSKRKASSSPSPPSPQLMHSDSDQSSRSCSNSSGSSGSSAGGPEPESASSDSTFTPPSSVIFPRNDKGKRRMLAFDERDKHHTSSTQSPNNNKGDIEMRRQQAEDIVGSFNTDSKGMRIGEQTKPAQHHQDDAVPQPTKAVSGNATKLAVGQRNDAGNLVLARSYPPTNLASISPERAEELVKEMRHKLHTTIKDGSSTSETPHQPFNNNAAPKEARVSKSAPGAIVPSSNKSLNQMRQDALDDGPAQPDTEDDNHSLPAIEASTSSRSPSSPSFTSQPRALIQSNGDLSFGVQDPEHSVVVSLGAGVRAPDLDKYTYKYGYLVPSACYPVGTAIFTTGGYGFASRMFGLSMDLTTELEVVLPSDGRIVTLRNDWLDNPSLSAEQKAEQEELWWAFRGAGTAFGIVTRIKARAYKIGKVLAGNLIFPFNTVTAPSLLKHWRDCLKNAPRGLYTAFILTAGPTPSRHVIIIQFSWCGKQQAEGEALLQSILSWEGERCLLKDVGLRLFSDQQENVSQILKSRDDSRWLVRSTLLHSLSDESIHETVKKFVNVPVGSSWLIEVAGGKIAEPPYPSCYPVEHRMAPFQTAALHQWVDSEDDEHQKAAAEDWILGTLDSEDCGPFPCFLASGEGRSRMIKVYGHKNWDRLSALKKKYDAKGLLRYTHFEDELLK